MANPIPESSAETSTPPSTPSQPGDAGILQNVFRRYRWLPVAVLVLVVVAVAGGYYWSSYQKDRQVDAADEATFAFEAFLQDSFQVAITGDGQNPGLELLVTEYSGTPTGNLCRFYLGAAYLNLGRYAEGIKQLKAYDKGENLFAQAAYRGIAYGYEELSDFEKAANAYLQASEVLQNEVTSPYYLFEAARTYELAGTPQRALELYQRIRELYPTSEEGTQVEKDIARLKTSLGK